MEKLTTGFSELPKVSQEKLDDALDFRVDQIITATTKKELDNEYSMAMDYLAGFFSALESLGFSCEWQRYAYESYVSQMYQLRKIIIGK